MVAWASLAFGLTALLAIPETTLGATPARKAQIIRQVFGPDGRSAVRVARCESGPSIDVNASNGQYKGAFQMGAFERRRFGHGRTILAQARAAKRYFDLSGWTPWSCRP